MSSRQIRQNKSEPSKVSNIWTAFNLSSHKNITPETKKKKTSKNDFFFFWVSGCDDRIESSQIHILFKTNRIEA